MHKLSDSVHKAEETVADYSTVTGEIRQSLIQLQGPSVESDA